MDKDHHFGFDFKNELIDLNKYGIKKLHMQPNIFAKLILMEDDDGDSTIISISHKVTQKDIQDKIQSLKVQLSVLQDEVQSLIQESNPLYLNMIENIDQLRDKNISDIQNRHEIAKNFANRQYDYEIEVNENNYIKEKEEIEFNSWMFIKYKYQKLVGTMKEAADYFCKFDLPFVQKLNQLTSLRSDNFNESPVTLTASPLLSENEISADLQLLMNQRPKSSQFIRTQKSLKCGKISFQLGTLVTIKYPGSAEIKAILTSYDQKRATFLNQDTNSSFEISLVSLNLGLICIEKC